MEYKILLLLDIPCQIMCNDKVLCEAQKSGVRQFSLSAGTYVLSFMFEGETLLNYRYTIKEDFSKPTRILRIDNLHSIYYHLIEEREAISKGTSLRQEYENSGYDIVSIKLETMCAVLPVDMTLEEGDNFDFFKAVVNYIPKKECDIECPYDSEPLTNRNKLLSCSCEENHPDVRCKMSLLEKKRVFYPYFKCTHDQVSIFKSAAENNPVNDLILYKGRWVAAITSKARFIPGGKHYKLLKELDVQYRIKIPPTPSIDIDYIEEHGWPDD